MPFIGNSVTTQGFTPAVDYFSGNGSTVTFTLSRPVAAAVQVEAVIDNVVQNPSTAYTVSGNAITFTSAPLSGSNNIYVRYTSLITTYNGISQSPSVIGDLTASGGYLSTGSFNNSFVDGTIVDYVTGNGRLTVGSADGFTLYTGGTSGRTALASWTSGGVLTNTGDAVVNGLTVGKGGGAVSTNTVVGSGALTATNTGGYITAIGNSTLPAVTSGQQNTGIGAFSGLNLTTGSFNLLAGVNAGNSLVSGTYNVALGNSSLNGASGSGSYNVAVGAQALLSNTTASNNTAVGYQSLYSQSTQSYNTAIGYIAGYSNTTGDMTAVGTGALYSNTTGDLNVAFGRSALYYNTTGSSNVAIGRQALQSNTTASNNTAVGYQAGYTGTTSYNNVLLGYQAGYAITTGYENIYIGRGAGNDVNPTTTGYRNILIGTYSAPSSVSSNNELVMGWNVVGKGSNTGYIAQGSGGVYQANNSTTWSITSDARLKKNIVDNTTGLDAINAIQVRNFEYRLPEEVTDLPQQNAIEITGVQLGAIAQELKEILPDCVKTESTGVMSVDTTNLTWYLINAVKELNAKVTALEAKLEAK